VINLILKFIKRMVLKKHKYPASVLIQKQNSTVIFEVEVNWYDEDLNPVSVVREVQSDKRFSIRYEEMLEFKEFTGRDRSVGNTI